MAHTYAPLGRSADETAPGVGTRQAQQPPPVKLCHTLNASSSRPKTTLGLVKISLHPAHERLTAVGANTGLGLLGSLDSSATFSEVDETVHVSAVAWSTDGLLLAVLTTAQTGGDSKRSTLRVYDQPDAKVTM